MIHMQAKRIRRMTPMPDSAGSSSHIPDDIIFFQILKLLPVKCLVRFQSVCKSWRATLLSTQFIRCHLEHSRTRLSMVVMPRSRRYEKEHKKFGLGGVNFYSFQPGQSKVAELILEHRSPIGTAIPVFSMPLHCDGLILIPCTTGRMFLCNPATREFVELPQGSRNVAGEHRVAFGLDPCTGKYKVARHFFRSYAETPQADGGGTVLECSAGHEILTVGDGPDAWKWKATMDPPYAINARTPICLPGFFYWSALHSITGHGNNKVSSHVILRFSLHDETFTVHPNPPCCGFLSIYDSLCELGGKLCYVHSSSPWNVDIWLAEDGPNLAWLQRCRLRLPLPRLRTVFACASADRDKIFLTINARKLLKCDLRDGSLEKIIDMADLVYDHRDGFKFCTGLDAVVHYMVPCVESLLRIRPL